MSDGTLTIPKLALREATSLVNRKRLSPEAFRVLDVLANRTGVRIVGASIIVKCKDSTFSVHITPDTVAEVFEHLNEMAPETHQEDE